jgi:hypothetical protein
MCIGVVAGARLASESCERNVALLNIVALAHALKVKPAKLLEPVL